MDNDLSIMRVFVPENHLHINLFKENIAFNKRVRDEKSEE